MAMKKNYTLLISFMLLGLFQSKSQDTLLFEDFQFNMTSYLISITSPPPGNISDSLWYNYDADQFSDGSGSANPRSPDWFQALAFADSNLYTAGTTDTNIVMASNSWFSSPALSSDWLITSNIQLGEHDTLFWKSAPFQTPRYLDGYTVKISNTTNFDLAFNTVLFNAAEMTDINNTNDSIFSGYTFSQPGFVHGEDGTFVENQNDSARLKGILKPFSIPLDAYANQNVFIAFIHESFDDNLVSIDDILIRGTASNPFAGIKENMADLKLSVFPNPTKDIVRLNFSLSAESPVTISVNDITGKLVYSENKGSLASGCHISTINSSSFTNGFYTITIKTKNGNYSSKLIVQQ